MRITDSTVDFTSQHALVDRTDVKESMRITVAPTPPPARQPADTVAISSPAIDQVAPTGLADDEEELLDPELAMLKAVIEHMTGRKFKLLKMPKPKDVEAEAAAAANRTRRVAGGQPSQAASVGFSIQYNRVSNHVEAEQTTVQAQGVIKTSDGKEIGFTLEMQMARARVETEEVHIRAGDAAATDPLVINFGRPAAELTTRRVEFDIDSDGAREQIAGLASGSGWLAFDKDGDGTITNGQELFGPSTGDGYAELASRDGDGNGWIDEGDPIFARLVLVTGQSDNGTTETLSMDQAGVGAIGLARVQAPFTYKDQAGTTLGVSRGAGVFVTEGGGIGTTQQVDVVV